MPYRDHKGFIHSAQAATTILPGQALRLSAGAGDADYQPLAAAGVEAFGVNGEATVAAGDQMTGYGRDNIVKVRAGASLGHGAGVNAPNASNTFVPAASGAFRVGVALESAAAGETFALHVSPAGQVT